MKQFYTKEVLVEVSRKEIQMLRVAASCWLAMNDDWKNIVADEDKSYYDEMKKLYMDMSAIMDALPF